MDASRIVTRPEELLQHAGWVRKLVQELVRDPERRADVEQETWLAALTRWPREVVDARGWLRTVARNALRQGARGDSRRERRERTAARPEALPSTAELVGQADLQRRVVRAVVELEEPFRTVVLLTFFHGLSSAEIARGSGLPASTVRDRLQRGLAQLRERFERELGSAEERRRVFLAWLALSPPRPGPSVAATLARPGLAVVAVLVLGTLGARRWLGERVAAAPVEAGVALASRSDSSIPPSARTPSTPAARAPLGAPPSAAPAARASRPVGRVVDEDGVAVAGALVTLAAGERFDVEPVSLGVRATSAADGRFAFPPEALARGGLTLFAEKPGFVAGRAGLEHGRDETVITLRRAATLAGVVREAESGAPIAGVRLCFNEHDWLDGAMRETITDAAGRFEIARVPPGPLALCLARAGEAFQGRRVFVSGLERQEVELFLDAGTRLSGRVVDGETGAGLGGAALVLDFKEIARSADDGAFTLGGIVRGERHDLEVRLAGFCVAVRSFEADDPGLDAEVRMPLYRECVLEGTVVDAQGAAVPRATLELREDGARAPGTRPELPAGVHLGSICFEALTTTADELGRFRLDRLEPWRSWELVARDPRSGRAALGGPLAFESPGARAVRTVALPRVRAALTGTVRVNGVPVRARVEWKAAGSSGTTDADGAGAYRLVDLEPGPVAFHVEVGERGLELDESLVLAETEPERHDFELVAPQAELTGFARRPDGAPVAGEVVYAFSARRPGPGARATTDAAGAFRLWVLADEGEALTVRARSGPIWVSRFPVPAGSEGVELVLPEIGRVEVRVLVPSGAREPEELLVSWRDSASVGAGFVELPRHALVPLGGGRWSISAPVGRIDLELRAVGESSGPVRLEGVTVGREPSGAPLSVAF